METICHCNLKCNAELIAEILDSDAEGKEYEIKAKAVWEKWENYPTIYGKDTLYVCSLCSAKFVDTSRYCANCGAFMEDVVKKYESEG